MQAAKLFEINTLLEEGFEINTLLEEGFGRRGSVHQKSGRNRTLQVDFFFFIEQVDIIINV